MFRTLALTLTIAASPVALAASSWHGQIIYQVMPDRFANGDLSNDFDTDRADLRAWHGGDLKGLTDRLGYIKSLGATAVWLTPVYTQVRATQGGARGYHGYWPQDFRNVDPHFGTLNDFKAFTAAARSSGLKVMLDQVVNHTGPGAPLTYEKPQWFHNPATCLNLGNKDVNCPIYDLPDLAQERPDVRAFLFENADFWRSLGVDAFRYDAIKHVPSDFLRDLLKHDAQQGTFTIGEYYGADAGIIADYQKLGFHSLFDFALQEAMQGSIMGGGGLSTVRATLERAREVPDPDSVALFLDNHDVPRFANGTLFEDVGRARTTYGLRALLTLRGIPVIWQGTEIAMRGGHDPDNRRDMRFPESWTAEERASFNAAKAAIQVRKDSKALSLGDQKLVTVPDAFADDLLLFTREHGGERVLVAWHGGRARRTYSVRNDLVPSMSIVRDLYAQDAKASFRGGFLHVSLPPQTAAVFRLP